MTNDQLQLYEKLYADRLRPTRAKYPFFYPLPRSEKNNLKKDIACGRVEGELRRGMLPALKIISSSKFQVSNLQSAIKKRGSDKMNVFNTPGLTFLRLIYFRRLFYKNRFRQRGFRQ